MIKQYHLIGIGGIGMSCIAQLLLRRGAGVSGSDIKESPLIQELRRMGAHIIIGHSRENIINQDVVIYSSAIREDNPEMREARRRDMLVIKRAQALAELMREKLVITVAGSHGKTTTTSLAAFLLLNAHKRPSIAIGGIARNIDTNACLGEGNYFVAEADESDGTFLFYEPTYSIITNIDYEHMDYYRDFQAQVNAFKEFLNKTKSGGCAFCCSDDATVRELLLSYTGRVVRFGLYEKADIYPRHILIEGLHSEFDCYSNDTLVGKFQLALGGEHNISNTLSVIALALELGIEVSCIQKTLSLFQGTIRRLQIKYDRECMVIDDYAHHPTEISATLSAAKKMKRRIIAIFQPHRYTRTQLLLDAFGRCFDEADYVVVTDIYPASEAPIAGVSGRAVFEKIKEYNPKKEARFLPKEDIVSHIAEIVKPDDLIITLGAGDIVRVNDELVEQFTSRFEAQRAA